VANVRIHQGHAIEEQSEVNDLLVDAIKAKLMILDKL
jgi:hypothetical protein